MKLKVLLFVIAGFILVGCGGSEDYNNSDAFKERIITTDKGTTMKCVISKDNQYMAMDCDWPEK